MSNERDRIDADGSSRSRIPEPTRGMERLRWYAPGLLWTISSVGSGSVLITPRIGSRYGYVFLWVVLAVVFFMWIMIREVGRYTVVSGKTMLDGYRELPGPRSRAIWFILIPQLVAGIVLITGIAALVGSVLMIALPGSQVVYAIGMILVSGVLVLSGRYSKVEQVSSVLAGVLVAIALVSAIVVFPGPMASGVVPGISEHVDLYFILPWIGLILAGAAGIMWYSYWVAARGYGGRIGSRRHGYGEGGQGDAEQPGGDAAYVEELTRRARGWLRLMSVTALIGVLTGMLVILSFLILGAELLGPEGIVHQGVRVAEDLTRLLSEILPVGGIVTAVHTPLIVFLTLYLNRKILPDDLRPGAIITAAICASGLFYGAFCVVYFYDSIAR